MKFGMKMMALILLVALTIGLLTLSGRSGMDACRLPVLMYHHFDDNVVADTVVSAQRFREQMTALKDAGYTAVTLRQVLDYVDHGVQLPEKPVLITMDDGYTSNLTVAAPILEELGMCATVFMIGIYEGEQISPNSGNPLYPARFSYEDAKVWVDKGVLDLQSHTYNMHQQATDGFSGRDGLLPMAWESAREYRTALLDDAKAFAQRRAQHGIDTTLCALAYPYGFFTDLSDKTLREAGIRITFTVLEHTNLLRAGDTRCLWNMGRFNVTERDSGETLVRRLGGDTEIA